MKIVLVGSCVKKEDMNKYPALSVAGNKMLLGFAEGFAENGCEVEIVSVTPRAMRFLRNSGEPLFQKKTEYTANAVKFNIINYINFVVLKQITIYCHIRKALKKLIKKHKKTSSAPMAICVYNTISYMTGSVLKLAKKLGIKTCGIIADLPIKNNRKNILQKVEDKKEEKLIKEFDMLIPLTEFIARDFAPSLPFLCVEAGINPSDYSVGKNSSIENIEKRVVFSGTLNQLSGIELAIATMDYLKQEPIILEIYGGGELKEYVEEKAKLNPRIRYCGKVDNATMLSIQKSADLLICPRKPDDYTTKYTFPSKVLEYICSGVPVLSNALLGIPEEYKEYISFADEPTPYAWALAMQTILKDGEKQKQRAQDAREKVLTTKSWVMQTLKVKTFIEQNL